MATQSPNFVEELIDHLVTAGVASTKGTDIFYREMPAELDLSPATMFVLKDTGGTVAMNNVTPEVTVQCVVRSATWGAGRAAIAGVYQEFHAEVSWTTTSYRIRKSQALQLATDIGRDNRERFLFSVNFIFQVHQLDTGGASDTSGHKDPYDQFDDA